MAMVPVICDSCGTIWGAENVFGGAMGGTAHLDLSGNKVSPCPKCGGMGSIPDGLYDLQDDTLKAVKAAKLPTAKLQAIIKLLESLRDGEASSEEVIERVEADAPELAPTIREALSKGDPHKWVQTLLAILALYVALSQPKPPSAGEVAEAIRSKPVPVRVAEPHPSAKPTPEAKTKPKIKKKRPAKTHGKAKQSKSRKRR